MKKTCISRVSLIRLWWYNILFRVNKLEGRVSKDSKVKVQVLFCYDRFSTVCLDF